MHWLGFFSSFVIERYNDFVLINGTQNTNIYDLSLVVTTVIDSLGVSIPAGFLDIPSKNSSPIERHLDLLKIGSNSCPDLSRHTTCSIMTDEGSALVNVASLISGYNHCLCSFHVHQLAVRVSYFFLYVSTLYVINTLISHLL